MVNHLYFIALIAKALNAREPERALRDAFASIERLGLQPGYEGGFQQFGHFMRIVHGQLMAENARADIPEMVESLLIELAAGALDGSREKDIALALVSSRPEWRRRYEALCVESDLMNDDAARVTVIVERPGNVHQVISFEPAAGMASFDDVHPGDYAIQLSTGCVLWRGVLWEQDLYWTEAYPGEPLALAADTVDAVSASPTRRITLLDGEVIIQVFAGIEHGRMEIELRMPKPAEP